MLFIKCATPTIRFALGGDISSSSSKMTKRTHHFRLLLTLVPTYLPTPIHSLVRIIVPHIFKVPDVPAPVAHVPVPDDDASKPLPEASGQVSATDGNGSLPSASPNAPTPGVTDLSATGASESGPDESGDSPVPGAGDSLLPVVISADAPTPEADVSLQAERGSLPGTTGDGLPGSELGGSVPGAAGDDASTPAGQDVDTPSSASGDGGAEASIAGSAADAAAAGVAALGGAIGAGAGLVAEKTPPEEAGGASVPVVGGLAVDVGATVSEVAEVGTGAGTGAGTVGEEPGSVLPAEEAPRIDADAVEPVEAAVEVAVAEHVVEVSCSPNLLPQSNPAPSRSALPSSPRGYLTLCT